MKKQRIFLLVLTVVIVCSLLLTSCNFVKVNKEREANEVLATVSLDYEGKTLTLNVTRNELLSYVNYLINLYSQYQMQYDVKDLMVNGLDGLINQKYMVLEGMVYLMSISDRQASMYYGTDEYKAIYGEELVPEGVLTLAERYSTISDTNDTFIKSIEEYVTAYEDEQRELRLSSAKEKINAYYKDGYSVDTVEIYNYNEDDETYSEGLYKKSFIYVAPADSSSKEAVVETDYKQVYLKVNMKKTGSDNAFVYLPVTSVAVTTAEKDISGLTGEELKAYKASPAYLSNSISLKTVTVKYDEPVKATVEGEDDTYKTHTATADFTLVTPRTAYAEVEEKDTRSDITIAKEGDVKFRYTLLDANIEAQKEIIENGQIFAHTLATYASDAEKDAYRQFREAKKEQLIGFDANSKDAYNSLGYYYKSAFESAVLEAVKHELARKSLTDSPITDAQVINEYNTLVAKQKEEYQSLTKQKQIEKFAETIKTDLSKCYYVPIDALLTSDFEYNGVTYNYATSGDNGKVTINMFYIAHILFKWTTDVSDAFKVLIEDRTDEEIKTIKTNFIDYLKTNKSKIAYATEGVLDGVSDLEAAFEVEEASGDIKAYLVKTIIAQLKADLLTSENPLETFQQFMSLYNDDSGSMSSKLGYFIAMGDIAHSYDGDDFPNMAKDLYLKLLADGVNPNNAKEVSEYAFTSYGLHIEYISFAPFYKIVLTENNALGVRFELDLDGTTFYKTIKDTIKDNITTNVYSEWSASFKPDEIKENHSVKFEKKLKKLIKDLNLD